MAETTRATDWDFPAAVMTDTEVRHETLDEMRQDMPGYEKMMATVGLFLQELEREGRDEI